MLYGGTQDTILESLAPYRIDESSIVLTKTTLGRGGYGVVILGKLGPTGTLVAVKQLYAAGMEDENKKLALVCCSGSAALI